MTHPVKTIEFNGQISSVGALSFVRAECIADLPTPLLLVRYALAGKLNPLGMRLDCDKRVFLDIVDDHGHDTDDESRRTKLNEIAIQIVSLLSPQVRALRQMNIAAAQAVRIRTAKQDRNKFVINKRKFPPP